MSSSAAKTQARIQEKRAAAKAAAEAERRRRGAAIAAVTAVVVAIAALVIVKAASGSSSKPVAAASTPASATVVSALASVPASTFTTVGNGSGSGPTAVSAAALTSGGKPQVLFVGDEWCPYCAAERWALATALSRFGTFTGLGETSSASDDVFPSTATLSFHGATYTSQWLSFAGYEEQDNAKKALDAVPSDVQAVVDAHSQGVPFVDLGGTSVITGAQYDPGVLKGKTQEQIAAALKDPTSAISKAVVGSANQITEQLCTLTGGQPANVCSAK